MTCQCCWEPLADFVCAQLLCTVLSMFAMVYFPLPSWFITNCACACPPNIGAAGDCGCRCCGVPNCLSSLLCGFPLGYPCKFSLQAPLCLLPNAPKKLCTDMIDLFKHRVGNYVRRLVGTTKPKKVIICMIYHLDEQSSGSWADCALRCLCYDWHPGRLQAGIEAAFKSATCKIKIDGTEVVPFPLFEVLDGKNTEDYLQRVEPSPSGEGRAMSLSVA